MYYVTATFEGETLYVESFPNAHEAITFAQICWEDACLDDDGEVTPAFLEKAAQTTITGLTGTIDGFGLSIVRASHH